MRIMLRIGIFSMLLFTVFGLKAQNCPMVFNPVVSPDGRTFMNACFAESAGISFYTKGVAFSDCVNPARIDPSVTCGVIYDPVVGCNGAVYTNSCEAEKHGVTSYMPHNAYAMSNGDIETCFDYQRIASAFPTAFNYSNGTLSIDCGTSNEPVCGCNGVQYRNPCAAEASGVVDYTYGECGSVCIVPEEINTGDPAACPLTYEPVCGCNGMTYINPCAAENSGVQDFALGNCSNTAWQRKATVLRPGQQINGTISAASGNDIELYPTCSSQLLEGYENVYVIHKTQPGDLQVIMDITTAGADLDLFVLNGMQNARCLGMSVSPPVQNMEKIVVENAPVGTYFVVVDAQYASTVGSYSLQTATGYFDAEEVVEISCGVPMATSNAGGRNNAITFSCDRQDVRIGSGQEMVYAFTANQNGPVQIDLFNMTADVDMYLLESLDQRSCIDASRTIGMGRESITQDVEAGTYYIVVDGTNGAISNYTLNVSCPGACRMNAASKTVSSDCDGVNGTIEIDVNAGNSQYLFLLDGAVTASGGTNGNNFKFEELPPGVYNLTTLDMYGCATEERIAVYQGTRNFLATASANGQGGIQCNISGGLPPYKIVLNGNLIGTTSNQFYTIPNVPAGQHKVEISDSENCPQMQMVTSAARQLCNISITAVPMSATCGASNGNISIDVYNGNPPFNVNVNGTTYGPFAATWFTIPGLSAGSYNVSVTDADNCTTTASATVATAGGNISLSATGNAATCTGSGSVSVTATGGSGILTATLNGAPAGSYNNSPFTISNVNPGTYTLVVTDASGCSATQSVTVGAVSGAVSIASASPSGQNCSTPGSIAVTLVSGTAPFAITLSGVSVGSFNTNSFTIPNVGAGTYLLAVTDANGCTDQTSVVVGNVGANLNVSATPTSANCSTPGTIAVSVASGTGPYVVTLNGSAAGSYPNNSFTLSNIAAGNYTVAVTDANGCSGNTTVTVGTTGGNLTLSTNPVGAGCGAPGSIGVNVFGGTGPYMATLNGVPAGGPFPTGSFTISNVNAGTYTLAVTDGNGCTGSVSVTVSNIGGGGLTLAATPTGANCGSTGSIAVDVTGGAGPYNATLNGVPAGGSFPNNWFTLQNVTPGTYTLVVTDGNGCTGTTQVTVATLGGNLTVTATGTGASCGSTGSIAVDVNGGTSPYTATLNGVATGGSYSNNWFTLQNVTPGTYTLVVTDSNGCTGTTQVTVNGGSGGFNITATPSGGGCGSTGTIGVDVLGGTPTYTVRLNGNIVGTSNMTWFNITNVPPGTYTLLITDIYGCTGSTQVTVAGGSGNMNVTGTASGAGCGSTGSIQLDIAGGTAPFDVYVDGTLVTTTTNRWYIIQNLSAGTYTIRVVDANGCEDTFVKTVSGNGGGFSIMATPSSAGCGGYGSIGVDVTGGTPTYTVRLNGNVVGTSNNTWFNVVNVPAGTYTLSVTDSNGCSSSTTVTVAGGNGSKIVVTAQSTNASCSSPASTQLDIVGGTAPFDIYLDGNFITNTTNRWYIIQNVSAGNHTVEVIDANGCSDTYKFNVTGSSGNISATATATAASCNSPGAIQLDIMGGSAPFQIDVDGNFVTITTNRWYIIQNLTAGNYEITITDLHGCSTTIWKTVGGTSGNLSATATATAAGCNSPGSLQLDITGGAAPFDIELDGNFVVNTNDRNYTITNVAAGSREIKITDKNGCSVTIWKTVGGGANISLTTTATGAMCNNGGTISLTIGGGAGPFDIELDGNLVATTNDRNYDIQNVAQGQHTIVVTDKNGCSGSKNQNVSGSNGNIILTATHAPGTCSGGGKIMLDIIGGVGPFDVVLDGNFVINTTNRWYTLTNVGSGTHQVDITDANGCTATTIEVVGGSNGFSLISNVTNGTCGFNKGSIDITLSGGTAPFEIYFDGTLQTTTSNRNYSWNNLAPGTYTVEVIDDTGCSRTLTETVSGSTGSAFTSTVTSTGCGSANGMIQIDITAGDAPFDIWLDGNVIATINATSYTYTSLAAGDYRIGIEDANGCETAEDVTILGGSNITVSANSTNAGCGGNDGSIDLTIVDGDAPFEVFVDGVSVTTTSDRMYTIDGLTPATYVVKVVDSNGCEDSTTEKILGTDPFSVVVATQKDADCGASNGILRIRFLSGDAPFSVYLDGTFLDVTSDAFYRIRGLAAGTYDVRIEDANGCSQTFVGTVGGGAAISFTGTTTACGCGQTDGKITLDITGTSSPFDIYVDGDLVGSTLSNDFTVLNLAPGDYDVRVVGQDGCDATNTYTVQTAPGVSLTTTSTACGCNGLTGTISVDLTGGTAPYDIFLDGTYITTTFNSVYTIAGLGQGTYTVKAVDANNCDASVTEDVQHFSDLDFDTVVTDATCGNQDGRIRVRMIDGTAPYQIYLNGNLVQTTNNAAYNINNLAGGSYIVRVSDANTCDKTESVTVNGASSNLSINATAFAENCGAMDGNIAVDIIGGDPDFEIYLDGVLLTTISDRWYDAMGLSAGTYNLRVVDRNGCEATDVLTVTGNSSINVTTSPTNSSCGNTNGTITVNSTGGLAPYNIFLDGNNVGSTFNQFFTVAGLAPGMYDVRVEDANGCFADLQETVNGGGNIGFSLAKTDESCGNLGTVTVNIAMGTAPFDIYVDGNLELTTSNMSPTLTDFFAGTYEVRVIDAAACEDVQNVTVNAAPALNFIVNAMPDTCGDNGFAWVEIMSGSAPYTIEVDGVLNGTTNTNSYTINDLSSGGYIVKVTDAQGCSDEVVVMINNTNNQPSAGFTFTYQTGGVVKFFSNNVNGNILWEFGDGTTSTDLNPIHTFAVGQMYTVCIKATNSCGGSEFCETLNIPTVYSTNLGFRVGQIDGRPGEIVEVPVQVTNFEKVNHFQFSMKLGSGLYARMVEVDGGAMSNFDAHIMNDETITISWNSDAPEGTTLADDYTIFTMKMELMGDRGDCTPIDFTTNPMSIEVMQSWFADPTLVVPNFFSGEVCINEMVTVAGNVHREDQSAIPDVEISCNGSQSIMSDVVTGDFAFPNVAMGDNCLLLPEKDGDDRTALTIRDLLAVRAHIMNTQILNSPYKIIAADMDRNQTIDGNDLSVLGDLILANKASMTSGDSWRFIPSDHIFPDPSDPFASVFPVMIDLRNVDEDQSDNDFTGMKLGDVDYSLDLVSMTDSDYSMTDNVLFETEDRSVTTGEEFEMNFTSPNFENIRGFQFELSFDTDKFEFVGMVPGTLIGLDHNMIGTDRLDEGILPVLWYDRDLIANGVSRDNDEVLYRLKFRAKEDLSTIEGSFELGNTLVTDLAVNVFDQNLDVHFAVGNSVSSTGDAPDAAELVLHQNYPNPFSAETIIGFDLPTPQDVRIELIDQSGKTILVKEGFYPQGYQQYVINGSDLPTSGIYFYRLTVDGQSETNKLIYMNK